MSRAYVSFMSYVRVDDQHENGRLTELCSRLTGEVRMQLGQEFLIFQDRNNISWGEQWKQRIESTIDATTFLIPIITPSFFRSSACRGEVERFLEREKLLRRSDLILPIYYVNCPALSNETSRTGDEIAQIISARQYADWRELRFEPFTSPSVGKMLAVLATQIVRALDHASLARSSEIETTSRKISEGQKTRVQVGKQIQKSTPAKRKPRRASQSKNEPPTLIVDALHRGDHSSLTEALRAAGPGHRIVVRPGLYAEGIMIDKPVEIIGDGERGDVVFEANGKDVILFQATMSRIVNLTIRQMGGGRWFGVDIAQGRLDLEGCDITSESLACVAIHGGADPRIRRNRICNGKEAGVVIYENGLGTLEDNEIFGNTNSGVSIFSGGDPTLRRNRIYNGRSAGVVIRENGIGTLEDNEIFGNAFAGIEVKSGGNSVLRRNRIHSGKQGGVFVSENGLGTLEDNEIFGNAYAGVEIKSGGNPTLRRNRIHDGKTSGILVWENGLGTLEDNEILGNAYAGVEIRSGGNPTLRRNVITKNLFQAVRVHSGGRGEIIENDLRDNAMGAIDISEECKINVRVEGNQE